MPANGRSQGRVTLRDKLRDTGLDWSCKRETGCDWLTEGLPVVTDCSDYSERPHVYQKLKIVTHVTLFSL